MIGQKSKTHKVNTVGVGDKSITRKAEGNTRTEDQVRVSPKVALHASLALVPSTYSIAMYNSDKTRQGKARHLELE